MLDNINDRERIESKEYLPPTQILSVFIIDIAGSGTTLLERKYAFNSDNEEHFSLFGGFVAAISRLCEDVAQDEVQAIQLGTAQFIILRSKGLLFTFHVGFGVSSFTTMAKLKRIQNTLQEKYGDTLPTQLSMTPLPQDLLEVIDTIIFEHTAIDLEQTIDYFLTGENIMGAELRDLRTDEILFTHSRSDNEQIIEHNSTLIKIFFALVDTQGGLSPQSRASGKCLVSKLGGQWVCGIRVQDIFLVSIFDENVDKRVILDIVYGKLREMLLYVAQYFQEMI